MTSPYSTSKILQHPAALERMARREQQPAPIMVDFMPMLACNQSCAFCSYGHRKEGDPEERQGWKNMELMSDAALPWEKASEALMDLAGMGTRAIELTGGGEPLIWPHVDRFFLWLAHMDGVFQLGLVTNGTALTDERADLFARTNWKWARVSIDAGCVEDYCATRRVSTAHWDRAWEAVERLALRRTSAEQRVGVGFVVDNTNYPGITQAARLARAYGADNIRITLAFSPHRAGLFKPGVLAVAREQAREAVAELDGRAGDWNKFRVHNLIDERACNLASPTQDYDFCGMQQIRCVIGGDMNVYRCCSQAFTSRGLLGSIRDQSFRELWGSPEVRQKLSAHDPRTACPHECLYEQRNKAILGAIDGVSAPHGMFV